MSLPTRYKGPYISMSSWYHSMSKLNYQHSILAYKEEVAARDERIGVKSRQRMANFLILNEIGESIVMKENVSLFDKGPFVLNHDDLSWENILVSFKMLYPMSDQHFR